MQRGASPPTPPGGGTDGDGHRFRLALVVLGGPGVAQVPADVVEAAARGAEAGVDLVQLRRVERGAEALQALAVVEAELGGEVVALQQPDVVDAAGERLGRLDL